ncbi:MAG: AbrB/MazE/SpoVT family DNA-binding domain-containing protein [Enterobacterales bacterium]|nr:AbrB/MazE/SpoVT family DNA-binding domain-containing protein [Enterobacterales bacterium]
MTSIAVRKSGGANIVSIPKAIIKSLGLRVGSKLDMSVKDNKIILTPIEDELSLESLLAGSPKECFKVAEEDREWIDAKPKGKEV